MTKDRTAFDEPGVRLTRPTKRQEAHRMFFAGATVSQVAKALLIPAGTLNSYLWEVREILKAGSEKSDRDAFKRGLERFSEMAAALQVQAGLEPEPKRRMFWRGALFAMINAIEESGGEDLAKGLCVSLYNRVAAERSALANEAKRAEDAAIDDAKGLAPYDPNETEVTEF